MTVLDRMDIALMVLAERWGGRRTPKAFYLGPADWAEFEQLADLACVVTRPWGNNPVKMRTDPAFKDVPVRRTISGQTSKLYDHIGYGLALSDQPRPYLDPKPVPADQLFKALDELSRKRALTDSESIALEQAMKGRVLISRREAIRLGVKL